MTGALRRLRARTQRPEEVLVSFRRSIDLWSDYLPWHKGEHHLAGRSAFFADLTNYLQIVSSNSLRSSTLDIVCARGPHTIESLWPRGQCSTSGRQGNPRPLMYPSIPSCVHDRGCRCLRTADVLLPIQAMIASLLTTSSQILGF